jgi:glycosyltransferase involved in cell wall biosynthesis
MKLVAVVPALDEAPRIGAVIRGLAPRLARHDRIVVVDDGSRDGTDAAAIEAARAIGAEARLTIVRNERPRGVGAAIARGYLEALALGADAAVVLAGDDQMDPRDLEAVLRPVRSGRADYVKGNRLAWHGGALAFPLERLLGVIVLGAATRLATGLALSDAQCGYTAIGRRALEAIDWRSTWPSFGYPNELLIRCARLGLTVAEVPVRPVYAGAPSKLRVSHVPPIARMLARATVERLVAAAAPAPTATPVPVPAPVAAPAPITERPDLASPLAVRY